MKKVLWRARNRCNKTEKSKPKFGYRTRFCSYCPSVSRQNLANQNGPMGCANIHTGPANTIEGGSHD